METGQQDDSTAASPSVPKPNSSSSCATVEEIRISGGTDGFWQNAVGGSLNPFRGESRSDSTSDSAGSAGYAVKRESKPPQQQRSNLPVRRAGQASYGPYGTAPPRALVARHAVVVPPGPAGRSLEGVVTTAPTEENSWIMVRGALSGAALGEAFEQPAIGGGSAATVERSPVRQAVSDEVQCRAAPWMDTDALATLDGTASGTITDNGPPTGAGAAPARSLQGGSLEDAALAHGGAARRVPARQVGRVSETDRLLMEQQTQFSTSCSRSSASLSASSCLESKSSSSDALSAPSPAGCSVVTSFSSSAAATLPPTPLPLRASCRVCTIYPSAPLQSSGLQRLPTLGPVELCDFLIELCPDVDPNRTAAHLKIIRAQAAAHNPKIPGLPRDKSQSVIWWKSPASSVDAIVVGPAALLIFELSRARQARGSDSADDVEAEVGGPKELPSGRPLLWITLSSVEARDEVLFWIRRSTDSWSGAEDQSWSGNEAVDEGPAASRHASRRGDGAAPCTRRRDHHLRRSNKSVVATYFHYYAKMASQMNMLQDFVRTDMYRSAILSNPTDFMGRRVIDVGAGSGILSFFAAQAGASAVYAVEASSMAATASRLAKGNSQLGAPIKVLNKLIEEVSMDHDLDGMRADVIVSEPLGIFLFSERMIESYLFARDYFLREGGQMYPNKCRLYLCPFMDNLLFSEISAKCAFWNNPNFYGVNLTGGFERAVEELLRQPVIDNIDPAMLVSQVWHQEEFDFRTISRHSLENMTFDFKFPISYPCLIHGIASWFDVLFEGSDITVAFTTAPWSAPTHWYQIRFLFSHPLAVNANQVVRGSLNMKAHGSQSYDVTVTAEIEGTGISTSSLVIDLKDPDYRYYYQQAPSAGQTATAAAAPQASAVMQTATATTTAERAASSTPYSRLAP